MSDSAKLIAFMLCLVGSSFNGVRGAEERVESLTQQEETQLRKLVYTHELRMVVVEPSSLSRRYVMNIPEEVHILFKQRPVAMLECLLKIAEGGRPIDARNASAFAYGAGQRDFALWSFFKDLDKYDQVDDELGETPRAVWVRMIKTRLADVKSSANSP